MPEGLSAAEVGKEIAEHKQHAEHGEPEHGDQSCEEQLLSIIGAVLLSAVALLAADSGYAAPKWSAESSVSLAKASAPRTKANRADLEALQTGTLESQADEEFTTGSDAGGTADKYVRDTVFLAAVLFLIGISGHVKLRQACYGLVGVGVMLLTFSVVQLIGLLPPPS